MKNKTFLLSFLILSSLILISCAGSRTGYGNQRKGYGCPATVTIDHPSVDKSKV
ncbi:MAG: hypothetical protein ACXWCZ_00915 [Flavisolibacter sp.]